ncbi:hypothetical protein CNMCM5878_006419 [Aspergillus fumigatiaffinis]|nr:hypothetical protein CNMCM5878_006419 [Aspergillus fumigatiaffinis]
MPRGRPRVYENDDARRQARNERRRQRRRTYPPVVVGSSSLGSPPSNLLLNSSRPSIDGLDPDFGHTLIRMERTGFDASSGGYAGLRILRMHLHKATGALAAFYEIIHTWYPILPLGFPEQYFHILSGTLAISAELCLALLVAAVGCAVQDEERRSRGELDERSDLVFFEAALAYLPIVISECSLVSVQCALMFAIYYCSLMKPCQALDYSLIASFKVQNWLKSLIGDILPSFHDAINEDAEKSELANWAYWAALLLEKYVAIVELTHMASLTMHYSSELSDQLDMTKSDLWHYDEYILLSDCRRTWVVAIPGTESGPEAASPTTVPSPGSIAADTSEAYFLAEIEMRRMLRRWNAATRPTSDGSYEYSPGIALEHEHQLESWYYDLPEIIRFKKIEDHPISPGAASVVRSNALLRSSSACNIIAANCPSTGAQYTRRFWTDGRRVFNSWTTANVSSIPTFSSCIALSMPFKSAL